MEYIAQSHGGYKFIFPRITVILGANGCGKSTLLRNIKQHCASNPGSGNAVYVEGGRTIKIEDTVQLNRNNFNQYQHYQTALNSYKGKRSNNLVDRVFDAVMVLIRQEQELKDKHSDAVNAWDLSGREGELPRREQPPLDRLFEQYNEIFPNIVLSYDKASGRLFVNNTNSEQPYGPSTLSDGEKQVFSLLADLMQLEDEFKYVIVDEPELNLHPELAERVWNLVESEYPEKNFLYATHSIQFALRSSVDTLYVISSDPSKISRISSLSDIPRSDLERFLGGVPGILNAGKVVVTEGHEKSFDSIFYRWILKDPQIEIFPCGNCHDVKQIIRKESLWEQISSDIALVGVVDSDFRSDDLLQNQSNDGLVTLMLHEAESFICIPEIICAASESIGSQENILTVQDVEELIISTLEDQKLPIALRRSFNDSTFTVRLSIEKSALSTVSSKEDAMTIIREKSSEEVNKAMEAMSEDAFETRLDAEISNINETISNKNILGALHYLPGKELLNRLAPKAGCKNGTDLVRSIKRNLNAEDYEEIIKLRESLVEKLA
jgi:ABC-type cobalamin/Fe3+-siderophores transport system ATPase subunit